MLVFRSLAVICFTTLFLMMTSTNAASLATPLDRRTSLKEIEKGGLVNVTISIPEFIHEFEKLNESQQKQVLEFFTYNTKPFGFSWKECFPYFSPWFRLPGCPPPPPEGCPKPPQGCRPPPPQWYCPKHKKPESAKHCPKPPPKPPICKPWQKGFYHLKPEYEHI
ncbi:uncharacterized protein FA14DRAFT_182650 [Meira miltonrushii]|uniref:Uncharacterized protein n=1 Tax=Meira miltonrushii TaxID=1280837 RepID=A0A316V6P5_9BASI|nr:uncharacterized protein FA14DRAFT_182650 [Meira miltonrushii]PWN31863.1 hypothetical protein FA14DRAFT_182650 [Meira miltonrushii]